jgi:hypothetical protein
LSTYILKKLMFMNFKYAMINLLNV